MKNTFIKISTLLLFLCVSHTIGAQVNRTLGTKVADILAQLPTDNLEHSDRLMEEIISLDEAGILKFCDMLVPLGTDNDTKARYAIHSTAIYAGGKRTHIERSMVEQSLLKAIEKASDSEVKTFLIRSLSYCATHSSIASLSGYLEDGELYQPALFALTTIGAPEAAKAILDATMDADANKQPAFLVALGELRDEASENTLKALAISIDKVVRQKSLMALAEIGNASSYEVLSKSVERSDYKLEDSKAILAFIRYGKRLQENGNKALSITLANTLLKNCTAVDQLHYRSAAIHLLRDNKGGDFLKTLLKEARNDNQIYVGAVLDAASNGLSATEVSKWTKAYKKMKSTSKPLLIGMLANRDEPVVFDKVILSAIKDKDPWVRIAGIKALALQNKVKALPVSLQTLKSVSSEKERLALQETLLRICSAGDNQFLADQLKGMNDSNKAVLVNVLAARNATDQFDMLLDLLDSGGDEVQTAVYGALPFVAAIDKLPELIDLLSKTKDGGKLLLAQAAIINVLNTSKGDHSSIIYKAYRSTSDKSPLLPVFASLGSEKALKLVSDQLSSGGTNEKKAALDALVNWKNAHAIPYLFQAVQNTSDSELRPTAFQHYLSKVIKSDFPDAQKLLLIRKLMPESKTIGEKKQVISAARNGKTFLSLVFVSEYLDDPQLSTTASNAAISIALPTPGVENGLSGDTVRQIVSKSVDNLTGPDSQYIKIDVKEFLDKMPSEKGFVPIFNGTDFSGWEGLVENPIARDKMSKKQLARAQAKANAQMMQDWYVTDGVIGFKGEGYNNICTIKDYGDFEMLVDWKITNGGDSGIYLRGTPQVQIWDIARTDVGAEVGSGGLYNNQKHKSKPLTVADNPINEWNTFRIKMVGERVTVHLNGVLVTDNVILENYWNREMPVFSEEAIELQAHGEDLGFRNIYVREITSGDVLLNEQEKNEGFRSLFNGKDLNHWIGNKTDYVVENNEVAVRPKQGGHGNLYTAGEYSDFIFRFEFKLTPGANNGLGVHTPLEGDAAYEGKELQILDNTAAIYADLEPYQYHGSVYGVIPGKRGFLKPVGEWNSQEVRVTGNDIKITLNGTVIVDGNFEEASKNGTADHKDHPGLRRNKGHIGFLGHGSELWFRNIRIKDLKK